MLHWDGVMAGLGGCRVGVEGVCGVLRGRVGVYVIVLWWVYFS